MRKVPRTIQSKSNVSAHTSTRGGQLQEKHLLLKHDMSPRVGLKVPRGSGRPKANKGFEWGDGQPKSVKGRYQKDSR